MGCLMLRHHLLCCAALRRGLAQGDAYARRMQPRYHVAPERNWLNDPNGLAQVDGVYHVFFQHNERAPTWGNIVWGHATSTDLARWTREPPILRDPPPYEAGGAWSARAEARDAVVVIADQLGFSDAEDAFFAADARATRVSFGAASLLTSQCIVLVHHFKSPPTPPSPADAVPTP